MLWTTTMLPAAIIMGVVITTTVMTTGTMEATTMTHMTTTMTHMTITMTHMTIIMIQAAINTYIKSYEYGYYDSYDYGPGASSYTEPEPEVVKPDPEVVADPIINDTSKDASVSKDSTSAVITEEGDKSVLKEYKDGEKCEYANECLSTCCFSNNIDWGGKIFDPS